MKRNSFVLGFSIAILTLASTSISTPSVAAETTQADTSRAELIPMTEMEIIDFIRFETGVMVFPSYRVPMCIDVMEDANSDTWYVYRSCSASPGRPCGGGYYGTKQFQQGCPGPVITPCVICDDPNCPVILTDSDDICDVKDASGTDNWAEYR